MKPQTFPVPANEAGRLKALQQYDLLNEFTEKEYDFLTQMASQICNTPVSLITLLDKDTQWVKSSYGFNVPQLPRGMSFCNYTILDADKVNVVPDLRLDERYNKNPMVLGEPHAVFYAGAPLVTPNGFVLGSICVLDAQVKDLTEEQKEALKALARQTIITMELRKKNKDLKLSQAKLKTTNKSLQEYVKLVSHDMKTPLANISMLSKGFRRNFKSVMDEQSEGYIDLIEGSANGLLTFIDQMQKKSAKGKDNRSSRAVNSLQVLNKVIKLLAPPEDIEISVQGNFPKVKIDATALQQVFQNLISNAIKYNDKPRGCICIESRSDNGHHYFNVSDNGSGMSASDLDVIFKERKTLNKTDRYGNKGTGIGLAKVRKIIESVGGNISVNSELYIGTDFKISIPQFDDLPAAV